jgi:calcineurin-like phosphoesterase
MDKKDVISRFTSAMGRRAEHSTGNVRICGAVLEIDAATGQARAITRLNLAHD